MSLLVFASPDRGQKGTEMKCVLSVMASYVNDGGMEGVRKLNYLVSACDLTY